jgi:hypothetical protein
MGHVRKHYENDDPYHLARNEDGSEYLLSSANLPPTQAEKDEIKPPKGNPAEVLYLNPNEYPKD